MDNVTNIDTLDSLTVHIQQPRVKFTPETIKSIVLNFELDLDTLMQGVKFYYHTFGNEIQELISQLLFIYLMTEASNVSNYIKSICRLETIPLHIRIDTAREVCLTKSSDEWFEILTTLCTQFDDTISTPIRTGALSVLLTSELHRQRAIEMFISILDNTALECAYRYKLITSLFIRDPSQAELSTKVKQILFNHFLNNNQNEEMYRILAGQELIMQAYMPEQVQKSLFSIATANETEYNSRADVCDVLMRYGSDEVKIEAEKIINQLGHVDKSKPLLTVYQNAQNAHNKTIENSVLEILEFLSMNYTAEYSFETISADILQNSEHKEKMKSVLNRIELDKATYSKLNFTLLSALSLVYVFIVKNDRDLMLPGLIDELCDCVSICSTGILERIVNSLSGYRNFLVRISFEEQIEGNLFGRLNSKIRQIQTAPCLHSKLCDCAETSCYASKTSFNDDNTQRCGECAKCKNVACIHDCGESCTWNRDLIEVVFEEMAIPTNKPQKRVHFLYMYRLYISEIMEEMRAEFLEHIDLTSFDLYFRKAMARYDCS